ncbi:MAG: DUF1805 domain-containing protein [bacterium]
MAVQCEVIPVQTPKGVADGVSLKWDSFSLLLIGAPKGFLGCCIFDLGVTQGFKVPCALVESAPGNPIGTIERMRTRRIMSVNDEAKKLGIEVGMPAPEALEKLF